MYISVQEPNEEDFLKAINFIPPKGMIIQYFISPEDIGNIIPGFTKEQETVEPSNPAEVVVYNRKDPATLIAQADTPIDYSINTAQPLVNSGAKEPVAQTSVDTSSLKCPFITPVVATDETQDIILSESYGPFKKNTLFHCVRG
ncbi:MAG: hypothetical protein HUJ68_10740 [Clostridia bacterium]|nr:hypothetical protein [Clostridia bacterium]